MNNQAKVERIREIDRQIKALCEEKEKIVETLPDIVVYNDGTEKPWVRFTKIDNIKELQEKGSFFKSTSVSRYSIKIENLKNEPKKS